MDQRKSKKTRSYGEPPHDARTSKLSGAPLKATSGSDRRSSLSDRSRSTPLVVNNWKEDAEVRASGDGPRTAEQYVKLSGKTQAAAQGDANALPDHVSQRSPTLRPGHPSRNVSFDLSWVHEPFPESLQSGDSLSMIPLRSHG